MGDTWKKYIIGSQVFQLRKFIGSTHIFITICNEFFGDVDERERK